MQVKNPLKLLCAALICAATSVAIADESFFGEGRARLDSSDVASIRTTAKQEALRDAVLKSIKDATALDASDPKFAQIVSEIGKQIREVKVQEERREGDEFVSRVEVYVDRKKIKTAIRGTELDKANDRNFSIMLLVDEFVTSTRDLNMPLKDLTEFSYDQGSSFKDKSLNTSASAKADSSSSKSANSLDARQANSGSFKGSSDSSFSGNANASGSVSGTYGGASGSANSSLNANNKTDINAKTNNASSVDSRSSSESASASSSSKASLNKKDIDEQQHEKISYKHLVEYQDASKPVKNSIFLSNFTGRLNDYDLKLQDASIVRSKFFGDRSITLDVLKNGSEMAKFSEFAKSKGNSDFLMMGTSTVVAGDKNPATGEIACAVTAEVKAFATAGSELIAAESESALSSGINIEACAAKASIKISSMMSSNFANRVLNYWTNRQARGRQYIVELRGAGLALPLRMAFAKGVKDGLPGADIEKKEDGASGVKFTATVKGKTDVMEAVYGGVSAQPAFATKTLDGLVDGENVVFCLDKCIDPNAPPPPPEKPTPAKNTKK